MVAMLRAQINLMPRSPDGIPPPSPPSPLDRYKEFITTGWEQMKNLGCVLGPVHPMLLENIEMLRKISGMDEVSFHMSGTEATMSACRLARFNTRKNLVVMFSGAYHGWWDGVQSTAGNERYAEDVLTLTDMAESTLRILRWRYVRSRVPPPPPF